MVNKDFTISHAAQKTGLTASAIRYYEDQGLLAKTTARINGRRVFDTKAIADLSLLNDLRLAGMTLTDIKEFQSQRRNAGATCASLAEIAQHRAAKLRAQIKAMRLAEERLRNFASNCSSQCGCSQASQCNQIDNLIKSS